MSGLRVVEYAEIRDQIRDLDMVCYGGDGLVSRVIRWWTGGPLSHTESTLRVRLLSDKRTDRNVLISIGAVRPYIQWFRLSRRIEHYNGRVWILPLAEEVREGLDEAARIEWLLDNDGRDYDTRGALGAGLDRWFKDQEQDFTDLYCTETWGAEAHAATLFRLPVVQERFAQAGKPLPMSLSEVTPLDAAQWRIFSGTYFQVKGPPCEIPGYNGGLA